MTATTRAIPISTTVYGIGELRLLRGMETAGPIGYHHHLQLHGRSPRLDARQLIQLAADVQLTGRGGAAFPVATKLVSLRNGRRTVLINATESEPASLKDRLLISRFPHIVLDGAVLVADAIGARRIYIAIHTDQAGSELAVALAERPDAARFRVEIVTGGFVAGEARALISALNGGPALPPGRRTLPSTHGIHGAPTFVSNVETFAQLAVLARLGPAAYRSTGTAQEPGTTLLTVGGAVARPGVVEVPIGIGLHTLLAFVGASPAAGLIVGGYHGTWVNPRRDVPLSRRALEGVGGTLGAGVILALDESTCALGELSRVASWLANESARQCGPCMFGLPAMVDDLAALAQGRPGSDRLLARHAGVVVGRGACAHPDGAARFIASGVAALSHEVELHRHRRGCRRPLIGQLPVRSGARR